MRSTITSRTQTVIPPEIHNRFKLSPADRLERAAAIMARHRLSLADAWIAACALLQGAQLVHKDPEFLGLPLDQILLPFKPLSQLRHRPARRPFADPPPDHRRPSRARACAVGRRCRALRR